MDKYNAILNKLQHTAPIVTDPEGLTQRIMKEIEQPVIRRRSKIRIIMTGIAASVLSVWMIDEINYRPVVSPTTVAQPVCLQKSAHPPAEEKTFLSTNKKIFPRKATGSHASISREYFLV